MSSAYGRARYGNCSDKDGKCLKNQTFSGIFRDYRERLGKMAKKTAKNQAKEIRADMLDDMAARGLVGIKWEHALDEYIDSWLDVQACNKVIAEEGRIIETGRGPAPHPAVQQKERAKDAMNKLATRMGFTAKDQKNKAGAEDDDDL